VQQRQLAPQGQDFELKAARERVSVRRVKSNECSTEIMAEKRIYRRP
jgi:hypothetical protein